MSMVKAQGTFRDSLGPPWLSGPRTDVPAEPPLIDLGQQRYQPSDSMRLE